MLELLDSVKPSSDCLHVLFVSYDSYTTNVPIEAFIALRTNATSLSREPLPIKYGGPVRVVIPHLYGKVQVYRRSILLIICNLDTGRRMFEYSRPLEGGTVY